MPFCGSCGIALDAGDQFCAGCGAPVDHAAGPQAVPLPIRSGSTSTPLRRGLSRRLVWGVAPLAVAVGAAVAGLVLANRPPSHRPGEAAAATTTPSAATSTTQSPAATTTRPTGSLGSGSRPADVTASDPPGLLDALETAMGSAYPRSELRFTYTTDGNNPDWLFWTVQGAPGYQSQVQPAAGFAHLDGSGWAIWGPGTTQVGCTAHGSQPAVPSSVIAAFGQSCESNPNAQAGVTTGYASYTNARFGFSTDYPTVLVAQPVAPDGSGASWQSPDGNVTFGVSAVNNSMGWSVQQDEAEAATTMTVTYHKVVGDVMALTGTRDNGQTYVYARDAVGSGSIDSMYFEFPANQISAWGPVLSHVIQSFRPGDVTGPH